MKTLAVIPVVLFAAGASAQLNQWQMVTWPQSGHASYLVDYTEGSGVVSAPRLLTSLINPNSNGVMGIDYAGPGGTLFAATAGFDNMVYSVSAGSGSLTPFASLTAGGAEGDLGFDPVDGMLYAVNMGVGPTTNIMRINPNNGSVTTILSEAGHGDISGIAFNSAGAGYLVDTFPNGSPVAELLSLDVTQSPPVISDVGSLGITTLSTLGLRFDGSDVLHMVTMHGDFYSISTTPGSPTTTFLDHIAINPESDPGDFVGLAWVPEPASALLLSLGAVVFGRRRH